MSPFCILLACPIWMVMSQSSEPRAGGTWEARIWISTSSFSSERNWDNRGRSQNVEKAKSAEIRTLGLDLRSSKAETEFCICLMAGSTTVSRRRPSLVGVAPRCSRLNSRIPSSTSRLLIRCEILRCNICDNRFQRLNGIQAEELMKIMNSTQQIQAAFRSRNLVQCCRLSVFSPVGFFAKFQIYLGQ